MFVRRYQYDNDGTEKSVFEFSLPVLYDNAGLQFNKVTENSKLIYKAILEGNSDININDKIVVNNMEYRIRSLNLVQYEGTNYIFKLEAEA